MNPARTEFARIAAREPIPLAHSALLIAKEEYPELDVAHYLDHLAALGRAAQSALCKAENTVERVQALSDFLFVRSGFAGNRDSYGDPRNSFLNDVIERRLGIPITLSVIYLEVGRRAGLNLFGVSFPSHFLVKAVDERGELIIDPFNGGAILDLDDLRTRLKQIYGQPVELQPAMVKAVATRRILARMLRNLKNIYASGADWPHALAALDRILILEPRAADELLERAALYERLECFGAALEGFQSFLTQIPTHPAADAAREAVVRLARQVARIN